MNQSRHHDLQGPDAQRFQLRSSKSPAFGILPYGMHVLFVISLLAFAGLAWASLAAAQHIRSSRHPTKLGAPGADSLSATASAPFLWVDTEKHPSAEAADGEDDRVRSKNTTPSGGTAVNDRHVENVSHPRESSHSSPSTLPRPPLARKAHAHG